MSKEIKAFLKETLGIIAIAFVFIHDFAELCICACSTHGSR